MVQGTHIFVLWAVVGHVYIAITNMYRRRSDHPKASIDFALEVHRIIRDLNQTFSQQQFSGLYGGVGVLGPTTRRRWALKILK